MPSEMVSVRRTVASIVAIELTPVTGVIRLDHCHGGVGQFAAAAAEPLPGLNLQQVGAELADLGSQLLLRRRRQSEHRHHRGDADRHADRRQAGAEPARPQAERPGADDIERA